MVFFSAFFATSLAAAQTDGTGSISGTVTNDAGLPLEGIYVTSPDLSWDFNNWYDWYALTDAAGNYNLIGLASGDYHLSFLDLNGIYGFEYYNNHFVGDLANADTITVTAPSATTGINAVLSASPTFVISDDATGGDCNGIGTWNAASKRCSLTMDITVAGAAIQIASDGITLEGNGHSLTGSGHKGVIVEGRSNVKVRNLKISNFDTGIYLSNTANSTIDANILANNSDYGILLSYSDSNTVQQNQCNGSWIGVKLVSSHSNKVKKNLFNGNITGANIDPSNNNEFTGNTFSSNNTGVYVLDSSGNTMDDNNLIDNGIQAQVTGGSGNTFSGNYFSDGGDTGGTYVFDGGQDVQTSPGPLDCGRPELSLSKESVLWASYGDFLAHLLTINMTIHNNGFETAYNVNVTGTSNTGGVITMSMSGGIGGFAVTGRTATCPACPGGLAAINIIVKVPNGIGSFYQTVQASAQDACGTTYTYP